MNGSSGEEIKCNGDEVSEEYVWSNMYGPIRNEEVQRNTGDMRELAG